MSNDFRSLLSTFQAAAAKKPSVWKLNFERKKRRPLLECTTQLWELSQLRQTTMSQKNDPVNGPVHVAVCLCVVDKVNHENIWKHWIAGSDERISADVFIHAKYPERITTTWARSKLLPLSHRPNWNDIRIVQAMLTLSRKALKDPRTTHILFGTESCLPICDISEIRLEKNRSYAAYFGKDECTRFDERNVWDPVRQNIPIDAIHKALPGWIVLSRHHAQAILDMPNEHLDGDELWAAFHGCWAPEEAFFPTALALLGYLSTETVRRNMTYAEWDERARNHEERAHPRLWDDYFDANLVRSLRHDHGCIVLRKIKREISLDEWKRVLDGASACSGSRRRRLPPAEPRRKKMRRLC